MTVLIRVLDTETTDDTPEAEVCELGWTDVRVEEPGPVISGPIAMLVKANRPMSPGARGIHHISDKELAEKGWPFEGAMKALVETRADFYCAHHIDADAALLPLKDHGIEPVWIDTCKAARRLWPDAPDFKNQTLRYLLGFDDSVKDFTQLATPSHRAGPDSWVTAHILAEALKKASVEELITWSTEPALHAKCPLKKHRGVPWPEVPADYLDWIVNKPNDVDTDVKWNAKHELKQRHLARRDDYVADVTEEVIPKIETPETLTSWWFAESAIRADLGIEQSTSAYQRIVDACAARKRELTMARSAPASSPTPQQDS